MVTGELRSLRVAEVASQEEGVVVEMAVDVGMRVEAGQLLARIDADRLELDRQRTRAERSAAESAVAEERAAVVRWQSELDSLKNATALGASNAREQREVDYELSQAQARFARAELDLAVFDARLDLVERRLRDMDIVAPFAGTVTRKLTEDGEWLAAGDSVCELLQTDVLRVVLDVPQRYLPSLAALARSGEGDGKLRGDDFVVEPDALSSAIDITDVRIVPQVDARARTFTLVGQAQNTEGALAAGQSVIGWVPTGAVAEHTIVPTDAVLRNEMGTIVYVARAQEEGPAQAVPMNISVLFELPGRVVVAGSGLRAGDQVVVEGKERLYPTAPIIPMLVDGEGLAAGGAVGADEAAGDD
ncbi:MAG: efflux RND transporter periplasmic adaptor subunit [Planctomycetota bacterium]|nr:MAG: efflux RND transporter periplasmic adaptor subunit [Planctomycetota bacterium]